MSKILVTYGTAANSTAEVAAAIGRELERADAVQVELQPAHVVRDLAGYDAVVLGTGVRAGRVYRETLQFLEQHAAALQGLPVAYFVVCLTMREETPENRCQAETYLEQMRTAAPAVRPVASELFGGLLDLARLPWMLRLIMKLRKDPPGDYRDWDAIRTWAAGLPPILAADGKSAANAESGSASS